MGLKYCQFGNVITNFWFANVTVAEIGQSIEKARAARQMYGPITGIAICSQDLKMPDAETGKYMVEQRSLMLEQHLSMHMVLPKGHFVAMRIGMWVVTALTLGTGREVVHHATVAEALTEGSNIRTRERAPSFTQPPSDILKQLERLKIPLS